MGYGQAIAAGYSNYFNFKDRSTRSAYWYFALFVGLGAFTTAIVDILLFGMKDVGPTGVIFQLATIIPIMSLSVRRLHDIGRTGWWVLLGVIPIIGWIVLMVFACQPTVPQTNEYGPPPAV
jgi:uncharacterized membrane protein YhaH (DUF805 family)